MNSSVTKLAAAVEQCQVKSRKETKHFGKNILPNYNYAILSIRQNASVCDTGGPRLVRFHLVQSPVQCGLQFCKNRTKQCHSPIQCGFEEKTTRKCHENLEKKFGKKKFQKIFRINAKKVEKTCHDQKNRTDFWF